MEFPSATHGRTPLHTRQIDIQGFLRDDGLFDLEAKLLDFKHQDFALRSGIRRAGEAVHDLGLRVTIDKEFTIREVVTISASTPYPGACETITPAYQKLLGLNLKQGFRKAVLHHFAGVAGCAHLTELLFSLPTAAIQTFATLRKRSDTQHQRPFEIDGCHALSCHGATVREHYPEWYEPLAEKTRVSPQEKS